MLAVPHAYNPGPDRSKSFDVAAGHLPPAHVACYYVAEPLTPYTNTQYDPDIIPGGRLTVLQEMLHLQCRRSLRWVRDHGDKYHGILDRMHTHWFGKDYKSPVTGEKVKVGRDEYGSLGNDYMCRNYGARYIDPSPVVDTDTGEIIPAPGLVDDLVALGIIEQRPGKDYQVGAYCRAYRYTDAYRRERCRYVMILSDKLQTKEDKRRRARKITKDQFLVALEDIVRDLCIDGEAAIDYIREKLRKSYAIAPEQAKDVASLAHELHMKQYEPAAIARYRDAGWRDAYIRYQMLLVNGGFAGSFVEYRAALRDKSRADVRRSDKALYTYEQFENDLRAIVRLHTAQFTFKRDAFGRIHTSLTNLSADLRQFIWLGKYPGCTLKSIDIVNSQPYILAMLLVKHYGGLTHCPADVRRFVSLTKGGRFYEEMMDQLSVHHADRKLFKQAIFTILYARLHQPQTPTYRKIAALFPNVIGWVEDLKAEALAKATTKDERDTSHGIVAQKMQGEESHTIIDVLCARLLHYNAPVLTLHDAVIVPAAVTQRTEQQLKAAFVHTCGLSPTTTTEEFAPSRTLQLVAQRRAAEAARIQPMDDNEWAYWNDEPAESYVQEFSQTFIDEAGVLQTLHVRVEQVDADTLPAGETDEYELEYERCRATLEANRNSRIALDHESWPGDGGLVLRRKIGGYALCELVAGELVELHYTESALAFE